MTSSIVTPKNAIERVLTQKLQATKFHFYENRLQKYLFVLAVLFLVLGAAIGAAAYFSHQKYVALLALVFLAVSMTFSALYQLSSAIPEFVKFRNAEREITAPLVKNFDDDMDLISGLSRDFSPQHLHYAREKFSLMANQLRSRIALLVGAIDKVGVVPIAVAAYISGARAIKDGLPVFTGVEWILVALICLYLFALRMCAVAQWLDLISLLYAEALAYEKNNRERHERVA